ncbi:50S ribosomal protein L19 [Ekhidna sp.]
MSAELLKVVAEEYKDIKSQYPSFGPGDTINVHYKIKEGNKERVQQFQGTVMSINNKNTNGETFIVRKVSGDIAVERIFPILTPNIDKIEVLRRGRVRRAKLYYLRGRKGKAARIKEKLSR